VRKHHWDEEKDALRPRRAIAYVSGDPWLGFRRQAASPGVVRARLDAIVRDELRAQAVR
jgi:hypothetical protein